MLDNWSVIDRWTAGAKITSHGPSGVGFVTRPRQFSTTAMTLPDMLNVR